MNCGDPNNVDCTAVLHELFAYIDSETTSLDPVEIQRHLDDCAPCMTEHQREVMLKALLKRSCVCEPAPVTLRTRIIASITTIRISEA